VRSGKTVLTTVIAGTVLAGSVLAGTALAAAPAPTARAGAESPAFTNPGPGSPSLSLSVSSSGVPEVASIGPGQSLWFTYEQGSVWHHTKVAGPGSAESGPSLFAGSGLTDIAVEGANHTLQFYVRTVSHWHRAQIAGRNSTYSTPSLAEGPKGPGIAAMGPDHSLRYYAFVSGHWHTRVVNGRGTTYSAPSLVIRSALQATAGDPAGEADIAVQNATHKLSYYNSLPNGHWHNDVIGQIDSAYSAPSLIVTTSRTNAGEAIVSVEGANRTLLSYASNAGWIGQELESSNWVHSAPWLIEGDPTGTTFPMAFQGSSNSLAITFFDGGTRSGWQNDPVAGAFTTYSAPAIVMTPAGGFDIAVQGKANSLMLYQATMPAAGIAPSFSGRTIARHGTTFGG
jgi:hypothetical protein